MEIENEVFTSAQDICDVQILHIRKNEHNQTGRSLMAQFGRGILPLMVKTGRYRSEPVQERYCVLCKD